MTPTHGLQPHPTEPGHWMLYRINRKSAWHFMTKFFAGTAESAQGMTIRLLDSHRLPHGHNWVQSPTNPNVYGLLDG